MTSARRDAILDAAFRCMARQGYERTSTAQICRAAGVSSGTFFHYFPTKAAVLAAVLERATDDTREVFDDIRAEAATDALRALDRWAEHVLAEAADEHLAGFVAVLGAVPDDEGVAAALRAEAELTHALLTALADAGQRQGVMRTDLAPERLAAWLGIVAHGVLEHAVAEGSSATDALRPEMGPVLARLVRP